jgi:hypothetical protein
MSRKRIGLVFLVGGILAIPVVAAWMYPHPASEATTPDVKAIPELKATSETPPSIAADPSEETAEAEVEPTCIWGVSKNLCKGSLTDGKWVITKCEDIECVNLVGMESKLTVRVLHNTDPCCDFSTVPCDDTESLVGVLVGKGEYHIRLNRPCPIRGWWQTPWDIYTPDQVRPLATGWLDGTLGTGTHRVPRCPSVTPDQRCGDKCELCYMAEFDASSEPGRWIIHVEGSMVGEVLRGEYEGCLMRVTMQGFFVAPADDAGMPIPPDKFERGWEFCGTADGVLECKCP